MNKFLRLLIVGLVWLQVAGCRSSRPAIVHETDVRQTDEVVTGRADSMVVEKKSGEIAVRMFREVVDSVVRHVVSKDSTSTIIREYHTERTDIDVLALFCKIDSMVSAKVDSIKQSTLENIDKPVEVETAWKPTWWERVQMGIGGMVVVCGAVVAVAWVVFNFIKKKW